MTDITAKPFDWNDNLSKEALEDFEGIQKDLPYCTCQNIGMALAKLELLEKQGCKVIEPSGSSSEKSNKYEDAISRQAVLDSIHANCVYENEYNLTAKHIEDAVKQLQPVTPQGPCEDAIVKYQKIKQMLCEFKEMPCAPCFMKGHICAVHEILNEVIDPSGSSSEKPKSECEHDHEILKAYSDGANAVLDKVRAEIEERKLNSGGEPNRELAFNVCLQIIDGYMTEEDKA